MSKNRNSNVEIKVWGRWRIAWACQANLPNCRELLNAGEIDGLGISPAHGSDFECVVELLGINNLYSLVLPFCETLNLDGLDSMIQLRHVVVAGARGEVDLTKFSRLTDASLDWDPGLHLPKSSTSLKRLRLDNFHSRSKGLMEIARFSNLESLELVKGKITSLEGIQELEHLQCVELHYMSQLTSIRHIVGTPVERLTLTNCKKLEDIRSVSGCLKLQVLRYHDSAPLDTIEFVYDCPALTEFRFVGVNVRDGNMIPLVKLQEFAFTQKKHFSHTEKDIRLLQGEAAGKGVTGKGVRR